MFAKHFAVAALSTAILAAPLSLPAAAQEESVFTPQQAEEVRKLVRQFLMDNPEVVYEALEALQEKQILAAEEAAQKALEAREEAIFHDPASPVAGNLQGDVTIVEFFDYRCTYCKTVVDRLLDTAKADGNIRVVFKELPILGPDSVVAARAALAAAEQDKYLPFHTALMKLRGPVNEQSIFKTAKEVGLDVDKLKADMEKPEIEAQIRANYELARDLNITGTPAFIIGDRIIPGAVDQNTLKQLVEQARKPKS
ncbi:DsbA family protein [Telmatospirillum sp. J64-1]|uniref:DsbA family protein n=1 Tax=Telmatospirillum sp. J64-1 TaxID=2502183 RepID=UPI00115CFA28|nr:DsbA family protein [Telmatospirillum sp. J64-1]